MHVGKVGVRLRKLGPTLSPTRIINVLNEIQGKFKSVEGEKKGGGERLWELRFVHSATYVYTYTCVSMSRPPRNFNSREPRTTDPSIPHCAHFMRARSSMRDGNEAKLV